MKSLQPYLLSHKCCTTLTFPWKTIISAFTTSNVDGPMLFVSVLDSSREDQTLRELNRCDNAIYRYRANQSTVLVTISYRRKEFTANIYSTPCAYTPPSNLILGWLLTVKFSINEDRSSIIKSLLLNASAIRTH